MKQKPTCYAGGVKSLYRKTPFRYNRVVQSLLQERKGVLWRISLVISPIQNGCCKPAMLIEKWVLQAVDCFLQSGNGKPAQKTEWMKAEALRCRNVVGMLFNFIGNTVIHSCVKVELSYEIKNAPRGESRKRDSFLCGCQNPVDKYIQYVKINHVHA